MDTMESSPRNRSTVASAVTRTSEVMSASSSCGRGRRKAIEHVSLCPRLRSWLFHTTQYAHNHAHTQTKRKRGNTTSYIHNHTHRRTCSASRSLYMISFAEGPLPRGALVLAEPVEPEVSAPLRGVSMLGLSSVTEARAMPMPMPSSPVSAEGMREGSDVLSGPEDTPGSTRAPLISLSGVLGASKESSSFISLSPPESTTLAP